MKLKLEGVLVVLVAVLTAPTASAAFSPTVDFTAVEQVGNPGANGWEWGLSDGIGGNKPDISSDYDVTSGLEMFWQLTYDGSNTLTYNWGTKPGSLTNSIDYAIGAEDFDYIAVALNTNGTWKDTTTVDNLTLQTDLGVINAGTLDSSSWQDSFYAFWYNQPHTFTDFTLSGSTTFDWPGKGPSGNQLGVTIIGGNLNAPVVAETKTIILLLAGLGILGFRDARRKRISRAASLATA